MTSPPTEMVSILIPAYNEPHLPAVVAGVRAEMARLGRSYEIIIIDDGSPEPVDVPPGEDLQVHRHHVNRGYGASLKQGVMMARGEMVLMMDSDGQHRTENIASFLEYMDRGCEAVLGSRQKVIHSHLWRMPGKWLIRCIAGFLVGRKIPDPNCGFRAVRTDLMRKYSRICPNGFSFSTTTTLILVSEKRDVMFLPLDVAPRVGKSTVRVHDGFKTMLGLLRTIMLFAPLRVLLPPSLLLLALGTVSLVRDIIYIDITQGSLLLLISGVMVFFFALVADQIASFRREMT